MFRRAADERVLATVIDEARRAPTPEGAPDALESSLLARIQRADALQSRRSARRPLWWGVALAPALGAAIAVGALRQRSVEPQLPVASSARAFAAVDGDALSAERVVSAGERPVTVVHAGRATWQLEANSSATVIDHGAAIRIRLLGGALRADVVPAAQPDRFVVEVADTLVSVHGTVFRVERLDDQTRVSVDEGVVSVGPRAASSAAPQLLRAPSEGAFTLDGARIGAWLQPKHAAPRATPAHAPRVPEPMPSAVASAEAPPAAPPAPKELSIGQLEAGVAQVVQVLTECFDQHTAGQGNVRISVRTSVSLDVLPDGSLDQVGFAPPLAPAVQSCGASALKAVRFAATEGGVHVTRVLEFAR